MKIKEPEWFSVEAKENTPEYSAMTRGIESLSNKDLISLLFKGKTAPRKAAALLDKFRGFRYLSNCSINELCIDGKLHSSEALALRAVFEISKRLASETIRELERIEGTDDAYEFLKPRLRDLPYEAFCCLFLNQKHAVISFRELFRGTINGSSVHAREVIKAAMSDNAAAVILAHNHPSGNTDPSPEDISLTKELERILGHLDVRVVDHIIVGGNDYYSFAREGLVPSKRRP